MALTEGTASEEFVSLLAGLRSPDNALRGAAEKTYTEAQKADPNRVFTSLAALLKATSCPDDVLRVQAATLLRRGVVAMSGQNVEAPWTRTLQPVQLQVRLALFQALEVEPSAQVRKILTAGIAAIASQTDSGTSWSELVPGAFVLAKSSSVTHKDAALRLLYELVGTCYTQSMLAERQELGTLVAQSLQSPPLQGPALNLVTELISKLDDSSCQMLQPGLLLPMVEAALKSLAVSDPVAFEEALQSLVEVAQDKPVFFKPRFAEWMEMMLTFAAAKGSLEDGRRALALEWVSTLAESKTKSLIKAVPNLPQRALEVAFVFLSEVEEDADWPTVDETEEEDDDESLHKCGEAKVDSFVQHFGFEQTKRPLMALLQQYGTSARWEGKLAAAMAIRASVEFVDDGTVLDQMAELLLQLLRDPHMRVRYAALWAMGQMFRDQEAEFHNRWHAKLVPPLVQACKDPVDRAATMAVGALDMLIGDLDESILADYAPAILETFVAQLQSSSHRGMLVAVMEALGALAAGLEGGFGAYYDKLMPMLLPVVGRSGSDPSVAKLRGKAFECISLLGYAVGKERFAPAAQQTLSAMLANSPKAEDIQIDCIREAVERMCKVMGPDFAPFLPALLPGLLANMSVENAVVPCAEGEEGTDDDLILPTDEGFKKVKTAEMGEIINVVNLVEAIIRETSVGFYDYIQPTVKQLAGILACSEAVLNLASSIRDAVYPCWAELVNVAAKAVQEKGQAAQALVAELVQSFIDKVGADLVSAEDPDDIGPMAHGIASVVQKAGAQCLQPLQIKGINDLAVTEILKSFQREKAIKDGNASDPIGVGAATQGGPPDPDDEIDDEDGDDGDGEEEEEQECRVGLNAVIGACMKANPEVFISQTWPALQPLVLEWAKPEGSPGRLLCLHFACDLCEYLAGHSVPMWPVFMDAVLASVLSQSAEERSAACFAVLLAAQVDAFAATYGARAYEAIATCVKKFKGKKNDEDTQRAADNAVAALVQLCVSLPAQSPNLDKCWEMALAKLPLKADLEESKKLNHKLFQEAQKPGGGNLGSATRLVQVLGYLCSIYGRSDHCDELLQSRLLTSFANLPEATLQALTLQLSDSQKKKLARIVQDARAAGR